MYPPAADTATRAPISQLPQARPPARCGISTRKYRSGRA